MTTKTRATLAALAAGAAIPALTALPAGADERRGEATDPGAVTNADWCNEGFFCFFTGENQEAPPIWGHRMDFGTGTSFGNFSDFPGPEAPWFTWLDQVESYSNNTDGTLCLYNDGAPLPEIVGRIGPRDSVSYYSKDFMYQYDNTADYFRYFANQDIGCPSK